MLQQRKGVIFIGRNAKEMSYKFITVIVIVVNNCFKIVFIGYLLFLDFRPRQKDLLLSVARLKSQRGTRYLFFIFYFHPFL